MQHGKEHRDKLRGDKGGIVRSCMYNWPFRFVSKPSSLGTVPLRYVWYKNLRADNGTACGKTMHSNAMAMHLRQTQTHKCPMSHQQRVQSRVRPVYVQAHEFTWLSKLGGDCTTQRIQTKRPATHTVFIQSELEPALSVRSRTRCICTRKLQSYWQSTRELTSGRTTLQLRF